jgi:hypothetical protein
MDDQIELFGRTFRVDEVLKLISYGMKRYSELVAKACRIRKLLRCDIENEAFIFVMQQGLGKTKDSVNFEASTGVVNCVWFTLQKLVRYGITERAEYSGMESLLYMVPCEDLPIGGGIETVNEILDRMNEYLSPQRAKVMAMRYATHDQPTYVDIAKKLKVCRERARQIEKQALEVARKNIKKILPELSRTHSQY